MLQKRMLAVGLAVVMAFSLVVFVGCGNSNNNTEEMVREVLTELYAEVGLPAEMIDDVVDSTVEMLQSMPEFWAELEGMSADQLRSELRAEMGL